ncbi:MAG: S8 family serine peptidase [bacterium]|nr:S8 family serine peptidase [bacterium]
MSSSSHILIKRGFVERLSYPVILGFLFLTLIGSKPNLIHSGLSASDIDYVALTNHNDNYVPDIVIVSFVDESRAIDNGELIDSYLTSLTGPIGILSFEHLFHTHIDGATLTEEESKELPVTLRNVYRFTLFPGTDIDEAISYLNTLPEVVYAEPEYIRYPSIIPNDGFYNQQWGLHKINANLAWDITTGSSEVKIAVIDSGIDIQHPDLDNKITNGYDYIENDQTPQDLLGHGTHVSGISAAETNNNALGQQVAGVSWNAKVVPLRVCSRDSNGNSYCIPIYDAINDASNISGVRVINLSLGGPDYSQTEQNVISAAYNKGIVIVASAGNCGDPATFQANGCTQHNQINYPAAYQNVIGVGATNQSDQRASFSNYGDYVDVVAPGVQILSTIDQWMSGGQYYEEKSGTSMAAPFVSGLASLILTINPALTPSDVEQIMKSEALDLGNSGRDDYYGWGRINAYGSVKNTPLLKPLCQVPENGSTASVRPSFSWTSSPTAENYVIQVSQDPNFNSSEITSVVANTSYVPTSDLVTGRTYYWRVWAIRGEDSSPFCTTRSFITSSSPPPTPPPTPGDNTPPAASGFTATPSGGVANISTSGVQDNPGGSGVREVRFSAKFNNQWVGIGVDTTAPYSLAWDMCASGVPDGDVELGMEVWDNSNNVWIWSQHYNNPHITKNYNCAPPPAQEGVTLYTNTGLGGNSCYITQDQPSIGNYCGSGWNDNAESVRVQGPYYFALFRDDGYGGGTPYTGNPTGDLPTEWRNQASSVRIRRNSPAAFTLFDLGDYNGESWASDRTIFDMGHWAWNDRAESIQVASGYGLIVCEHSDFKGVCGRATGPAQWSDINALAQGLRNGVSSIRVCSGTCPEAGPPPTLNYPINNQTVDTGQAVVFSWSGPLNQFYVEVWGGGLGSTLQHGWTSNAEWNAGVLPQSANPYHWQVKGWRGYGETGWATGSFYVTTPDTTPPSGVITAPNSGGYRGGPTVTLAATASDSGSGVNRLEFYAWLDDRWEF